jgi:beta-glucosidase
VAKHILFAQLKFYAARDSKELKDEVVFCQKHRNLALEGARRSMVLLQNNPARCRQLLPLKPKALSKLAVLGCLANAKNTGDRGCSPVCSPEATSP